MQNCALNFVQNALKMEKVHLSHLRKIKGFFIFLCLNYLKNYNLMGNVRNLNRKDPFCFQKCENKILLKIS